MPTSSPFTTNQVLASAATDALGDFGLTTVRLAVIWLGSLAITLAGAGTGALVFYGIRDLATMAHRQLRRGRPEPEYARLVTVHPDGVTTETVNLDHYRQRHGHRRDNSRTGESRPDDDPA